LRLAIIFEGSRVQILQSSQDSVSPSRLDGAFEFYGNGVAAAVDSNSLDLGPPFKPRRDAFEAQIAAAQLGERHAQPARDPVPNVNPHLGQPAHIRCVE
jgi:hypothetical protein